MIRARLLTVIASIAVATTTPTARAQSWDLIYADQLQFTACEGCALTLAGADFALLVNTGASPFDGPTLAAGSLPCVTSPDTTCFAQSSHPGFRLFPFYNELTGAFIAPVLPDEAVGGVIVLNPVLLGPIAPGETFRNTAPNQYLAFQIERLPGTTYEGEVVFDLEMFLAGAKATFQLRFNMLLGETEIQFLHAARVSSAPIPTTSHTSTWGRLKTLYR